MDASADGTRRERVYDWWSCHPRALDILYGFAFLGRESAFRRRALDALDLRSGERVLEIGCGTGNGFAALRRGVGSSGAVIGLDASHGMARSARDRVREMDVENVHVVRGDARRPPVAANAFDAAAASMSLTAVPDPTQAIEAVATALRPSGRFVVLDAQPFSEWPWRLANRIVVPIAKRTTNWVPAVDLVAALRRSFGTVEVETFHAGSIIVARAWVDDPA